jgi:hypothetical protein
LPARNCSRPAEYGLADLDRSAFALKPLEDRQIDLAAEHDQASRSVEAEIELGEGDVLPAHCRCLGNAQRSHSTDSHQRS